MVRTSWDQGCEMLFTLYDQVQLKTCEKNKATKNIVQNVYLLQFFDISSNECLRHYTSSHIVEVFEKYYFETFWEKNIEELIYRLIYRCTNEQPLRLSESGLMIDQWMNIGTMDKQIQVER